MINFFEIISTFTLRVLVSELINLFNTDFTTLISSTKLLDFLMLFYGLLILLTLCCLWLLHNRDQNLVIWLNLIAIIHWGYSIISEVSNFGYIVQFILSMLISFSLILYLISKKIASLFRISEYNHD